MIKQHACKKICSHREKGLNEEMEKAVVYIHGKGGSADEAEHYEQLFTNCDVIGFDYKAQTPWDAVEEFTSYFNSLRIKYKTIRTIANSIGAYFAMSSLSLKQIDAAFFISPVVDMEQLIKNMMQWTGVTEAELLEKGSIETSFGETLTYEYLT